jgi:hypothetical protein
MKTSLNTKLRSIDSNDLRTASGGQLGPAGVVLGPLQALSEREVACKQLQAAKADLAKEPNDKQAQQWVAYKRQFCPFNLFNPKSW